LLDGKPDSLETVYRRGLLVCVLAVVERVVGGRTGERGEGDGRKTRRDDLFSPQLSLSLAELRSPSDMLRDEKT